MSIKENLKVKKSDSKNKRNKSNSLISHSAYRKYLNCPAMYDNYYNKELREDGTSSALLMGTAIDEALNSLLLKTGDPYQIFKDNFKEGCLDGVKLHKNDFDEYIFNKDQLEKIQSKSKYYKAWASLRVKGRMFIDAYKAEILPMITKVHSVQRELKGRKGYIDAVLELEGYGKVLIDHKTASRPYKDNVIESDTQLHLYAKDQGIDKIGFIVMNKQIDHNKICSKCKYRCETSHKTCPKSRFNKRCHGEWIRSPSVNIQVIVDTVNPFQSKVLSNSIKDVENAIEKGVFPMNLGACHAFYGADCPYKDFCRQGDTTGLSYKKKLTKGSK